jgi:superfamily II DNA/RNA helicase
MGCAQVGVFSATLPPEALEITRKFMNKPVRRSCCPSAWQTLAFLVCK